MNDKSHVVGVAAVLIAPDGQVLLQHRKKNPGSGLYVLPGGRLENENSRTGCARELEEELGLRLYPPVLFPLYHAADTLGTGEPLIMLYFGCRLTEDQRQKITNMEPEKCYGLHWHNPWKVGGVSMWQNDRDAIHTYLNHYG